MMPPPPSVHQSSRHDAPPNRSSSMGLRPHAFPSLPLPPPPGTVNPRVRPRTGSMDAVNAPAVKRLRGDSDRVSRDERAMFNESVRHVHFFTAAISDGLSVLHFLSRHHISTMFGTFYFRHPFGSQKANKRVRRFEISAFGYFIHELAHSIYSAPASTSPVVIANHAPSGIPEI
jgi:hypothetical protein